MSDLAKNIEANPQTIEGPFRGLRHGLETIRRIGRTANIFARLSELESKLDVASKVIQEYQFLDEHSPVRWTRYDEDRKQLINSGAPTWKRQSPGIDCFSFFFKGDEIAFIDRALEDNHYTVNVTTTEGVDPHIKGTRVSLWDAIELTESLIPTTN